MFHLIERMISLQKLNELKYLLIEKMVHLLHENVQIMVIDHGVISQSAKSSVETSQAGKTYPKRHHNPPNWYHDHT